jgi:hypothetical protein
MCKGVTTMILPGLVREGEVYNMTTNDGKTVSIRSCAGGLGGHAHRLFQDKEKTTNEDIVFNLDTATEVGHTHTGNNPHTLNLATGIITPNVTSTDGLHNHCLKVVENK